MAHTLDAVSLPSGLIWTDEFDWTEAEHEAEYSITGAVLVDAAVRLAGRPITLQGEEDAGWIDRSVLLAVQALAAAPGQVYTFVHHDGRSFSAVFAPRDPITARAVARPELPPSDWPYVATIRLIEV